MAQGTQSRGRCRVGRLDIIGQMRGIVRGVVGQRLRWRELLA